MDAYRLESLVEFRDLGMDEYYDEGVTVIEWGGKVAEDFEDYLELHLQHITGEDTARQIVLKAQGRRWQQALPLVQEALKQHLP